MQKMTPSAAIPATRAATPKVDVEDDVRDEGFKPLTREEAQKLRDANPSVSPWEILLVQLGVGVLVAGAAWALTGRLNVGWSAFYGALAVVIPAALFARGLTSKLSSMNAGAALFGFFLWEAVKIAASVGMLFAAPQLVAELDWLAMLIGLIVTLQVYWVALLMRPKRKRSFSGD